MELPGDNADAGELRDDILEINKGIVYILFLPLMCEIWSYASMTVRPVYCMRCIFHVLDLGHLFEGDIAGDVSILIICVKTPISSSVKYEKAFPTLLMLLAAQEKCNPWWNKKMEVSHPLHPNRLFGYSMHSSTHYLWIPHWIEHALI